MTSSDIDILGAGVLGTTLAWTLQSQQHRVRLFAAQREGSRQLRWEGSDFKIHAQQLDPQTWQPAPKVYMATKLHQLWDHPGGPPTAWFRSALEPLQTSDAQVLFLQNGLEMWLRLARADQSLGLGDRASVGFWRGGGFQASAGQVTLVQPGQFVVLTQKADWPGTLQAPVDVALPRLVQKAQLNLMINPLGTAFDLRNGELATTDWLAQVAAELALGISDTPGDLILTWLRLCRQTAGNWNSSHADRHHPEQGELPFLTAPWLEESSSRSQVAWEMVDALDQFANGIKTAQALRQSLTQALASLGRSGVFPGRPDRSTGLPTTQAVVAPQPESVDPGTLLDSG